MRLPWMVAGAMVGLLAAQAAGAWPVELRFGEPPAESPFTTPSCREDSSAGSAGRVWQIEWLAGGPGAAAEPPVVPALDLGSALALTPLPSLQETERRPVAIDYGPGYDIRQRVHKYASIATVPLFVAETWLGQSLYNHPGESESKKGVHGAVAASIGVLFGVNSVTGVWNLWDARNDPAGRTRRTVHGVLMLVADAGFVATGALAPDYEGGEGRRGSGTIGPIDTSRGATHRAVAFTSMGIALASYVMMLVWRD